MARTKKGTPPAYPAKPHRSGQARITVRLISGKRRDLTLGPHGSPESRVEYRRVLAELEANGGSYPVKDDGTPATGLTVAELTLLFWKHAEAHYRPPGSWTTSAWPSNPSSTSMSTRWPASSAHWRSRRCGKS